MMKPRRMNSGKMKVHRTLIRCFKPRSQRASLFFCTPMPFTVDTHAVQIVHKPLEWLLSVHPGFLSPVIACREAARGIKNKCLLCIPVRAHPAYN